MATKTFCDQCGGEMQSELGIVLSRRIAPMYEMPEYELCSWPCVRDYAMKRIGEGKQGKAEIGGD